MEEEMFKEDLLYRVSLVSASPPGREIVYLGADRTQARVTWHALQQRESSGVRREWALIKSSGGQGHPGSDEIDIIENFSGIVR